MHSHKKTAALDMMSFGLLVALAAACGEAGTASTEGTGDESTTSAANTTSAASTTSGVASTGGSTSGEPATSTPSTTSSDGSTSDGSAASASSTSGEGTTTEAASSSSSTGSTGTGGDPPPLTEYCDCMLSKCHDQYHMKFGEDHVAAEMMCLAYAASVPTIGMPAESGASIECYYWACMQSDCTSAFGGGVCQ